MNKGPEKAGLMFFYRIHLRYMSVLRYLNNKENDCTGKYSH